MLVKLLFLSIKLYINGSKESDCSNFSLFNKLFYIYNNHIMIKSTKIFVILLVFCFSLFVVQSSIEQISEFLIDLISKYDNSGINNLM
jgi:hypothetical protein